MVNKYSFNAVANVKFARSLQDLGHPVKTTMSIGKLYPVDWQEVVAGDTFKGGAYAVARVTSSFLKPVMDNAFIDIVHFFVPYRLLYKDTERVFGNPNPSAYEDNDLAEFPTLPAGTVVSGSIADYLGIRPGSVPAGVSVLPFRAFALIYDKWYRNENTVSETYINLGETAEGEEFNGDAFAPDNIFGMPPYVGKRKDYFTSCLPAPQKGASVLLPLGDLAPVDGEVTSNLVSDGTLALSGAPSPNLGVVAGSDGKLRAEGGNYWLSYANGLKVNSSFVGNADLSEATASNVNELRFAFALQRALERDARGGSRMSEYLEAHFGVSNPDARLQLPEYLAGAQIPIGVQQVAQTSAPTVDSPLAGLGAFSYSRGYSKMSKSFTEPGILMTVACIRTMHTYQQGIKKSFFRTKREDFYDPVFAHLGEQPVYTSELYLDGSKGLKETIFGYNEAWADYRFCPSLVTAQMRSGIANSLDIWHFADKYASAPVLGEDFTNETADYFDRTVSVPSSSQDNFIMDFYFDFKAYRVMPLYSVPGLIDHN